MDKNREKVDILGIKFDNLSLLEVTEKVKKLILKDSEGEKFKIFTPNPEFVVEACGDSDFKRVLNDSDLNLVDGVGIIWASKVLGNTIKDRVTGADLVNTLLRIGNEDNYNFFFLGGKRDTAKRAARNAKTQYPLVKIGWYGGEPTEEFDKESCQQIKDYSAKEGKIDILLVAYGHNKQEKWIDRNLGRLPVKVAIGVGGVLDYLAGNKKRAPKIIQSLSLEWLFRLIQEPWRVKRQKALLQFAYLVLKEFLNNQRIKVIG